MEQLQRVTPPTLDVLETLLAQGDEGPVWGLVIIKATGRPSGTVYPILERLERLGWITGSWEDGDRPGPRRRLYEFTSDGRAAAAELMQTAEERRHTAAARPSRSARPATGGATAAGSPKPALS